MTILHVAEEQGRPLRRRALRRRSPRPLVLPVVLFAGLAVMAVVYIAYVLWPRWPAQVEPNPPALPIMIAGVSFNIPTAAVRVPVQRRPGAHERIDLAFLWPSLEPAGSTVKPSAPTHATPPAPAQTFDRIFLTIAAVESSLPPADRVLTIYSRYTVAEAVPGPGRLSVLAFRDGTPYQGEDIIYDAEAPDPLMRCSRRTGPIPGTCLYERWIDAAKLVLRFPRDWLADWPTVAGHIDRLIASLRPPRG